jgi:hypothetical protein
MSEMTAEQKLQHMVLLRHAELNSQDAPTDVTAENVTDLFDAIDEPYEAMSEVRGSYETETNIRAPYSRHYEAKSVAAKAPDGSWVGWTYWYGGGKHSEPDAVEWISDAYDLTCTEEQKMVTVQTFAKVAGE